MATTASQARRAEFYRVITDGKQRIRGGRDTGGTATLDLGTKKSGVDSGGLNTEKTRDVGFSVSEMRSCRKMIC